MDNAPEADVEPDRFTGQGGPEHRVGGVLVGGDSQEFEGRAIAPA
ncbi:MULTISPECIES: hypothetical protein [Methylobacterium]|jgi:hypothetical protein|nr:MULTISPECIES: hypothetical protein [Methylobacterium]WFS06955.1 hypothetical protein P9K36_26895 [Methylobacterium sp. 391_Methyba4]